jgi:membrane protease YdiL (CAAX protease family)
LVNWCGTGTRFTKLPKSKPAKNEIVSRGGVGYAGSVLWKKTWQPEMVLALVGGILMLFFTGSVAAELLRHAHVAGFKTPDDSGNVVLATLCFHGSVIIAGIVFLKFHDITLREALGLEDMNWGKQILLVGGALLLTLPVMFGLKYLSEILLQMLHQPLSDQRAVEAIVNAKSPALRGYLFFFAIIIAPVAEEFFFRGLVFSAAQKAGWPKTGWIGSSLLFAAIHGSAPVFLPLFAFALVLVWLYQKTQGLLAPIAAHAAFNAINVVILVLTNR